MIFNATLGHELLRAIQDGSYRSAAISFATILAGLCIAWYFSGHRREDDVDENVKCLPLPPNATPAAIPLLFDDTLPFLGGKAAHLLEQRKQRFQGAPFRTSLFGAQTVHLYTHQQVRKVLAGEHDFVEVHWPPQVLNLLGHESLIAIHNEAHIKMRRLFAPAFTAKSVEEYLPQIQSIVEEYCDNWGHSKQVEFVQEARGVTFHVMLSIIMGFDDWLEDERLTQSRDLFNKVTKALFDPPIYIPGTRAYAGLQSRKRLVSMIRHTVEQKIQKLRGGSDEGGLPSGQLSLLDTVIATPGVDGEYMHINQIVDMVVVMLFAGHDTSASTLMHLLWKLHSSCPEVVEKLRDEQQQIVQQFGSSITSEALRAMKYTTAVVQEALRTPPIVPGVFRKALKTFKLDGYRIPKGMDVVLHIGSVTQYDSCNSGDPRFPVDDFIPERWLNEGAVRQTAWVPFGGGPRMCLGYPLALAELKVVLAVLARGWQWSTPGKDLQWNAFPILRPEGDTMMVAFHRLTTR